MTSNNDELDIETVKRILITTREKLFNVLLVNIELETALALEREAADNLKKQKLKE
jgi:hypothetical protein